MVPTRGRPAPGHRRQPPERQPGRRDEGVGVQHPQDTTLRKNRSTRPSRSARSRLARYARAMETLWARYQRPRRRAEDELQAGLHRGRGRLARRPQRQVAGLGGVAQDRLVDGAPPRAPRPRRPRRLQQPPAQLPRHERRHRAAVGEVPRARGAALVEPAHQPQPPRRIVADPGHRVRGELRCGRGAVGHAASTSAVMSSAASALPLPDAVSECQVEKARRGAAPRRGGAASGRGPRGRRRGPRRPRRGTRAAGPRRRGRSRRARRRGARC